MRGALCGRRLKGKGKGEMQNTKRKMPLTFLSYLKLPFILGFSLSLPFQTPATQAILKGSCHFL